MQTKPKQRRIDKIIYILNQLDIYPQRDFVIYCKGTKPLIFVLPVFFENSKIF